MPILHKGKEFYYALKNTPYRRLHMKGYI